MTDVESELLEIKLSEYMQTPGSKQFSKRLKEYEKKLYEMVELLGASPFSEGEELDMFNRLYGEFRETDIGKYYDEYFSKVNDELYALTVQFGIYS